MSIASPLRTARTLALAAAGLVTVALFGALFLRSSARAQEDFVTRLTSPEEATRRAAVLLLNDIAPDRHERYQRAALTMLESPDLERRVRGIFALASLTARGQRVNMETLLRRDPEPAVRFAAALFLPTLGGRRSAGALSEALTDSNRIVRWTSARSLGQLPLADLLELVLWRVPVDDPDRAALIELLSQSSLSLESRAAWQRLLTSTRPEDRRLAVRALAAIADPRAGDDLCARLDDPDPLVRASAAMAVAELNDNRIEPKLIELTQDPDVRVRANALRALGLLQSERTLEVCARALASPAAPTSGNIAVIRPPVVQFHDRRGRLVRFPFTVAADLLAPAQRLDWEGSHERSEHFGAVIGLVLNGDAKAEPLLARAANDSDPRVREAASVGLTVVSKPETMVAVLQDAKRPLRARLAAAQWLGQRDLAGRLSVFLEASRGLLDSGDESADSVLLLEELLRLLGRSRDPRVLPVLELARDHPVSQVRIAAVRGLAMVGGEEARALVEDIARNDYDRSVAEVANRELGRFIARGRLGRMRRP